MKTHTNDYKNAIKQFGKEINIKIIYGLNQLDGENINSVNMHYESSILKSVMKQLDIDSNIEIPLGTIVNYQFGLKVGNSYEYLDYGNFIVYKIEKKEDTNSWNITCYDKMLYSMKDYEDLGIIYPITIRNYINAICTKIRLTFANLNDTFANYNREIKNELYLDSNGKSIGYTYRDVLDELAQVVGGVICINDDDELEIRYPNETNDTIDEEYLKDINVNFGEKFGPVNSIVLTRANESDSVYLRDEESVLENGLCELKIVDNQIMNFNDREDYLQDLLNKLDGLEYYYNNYSSTGITYYDLLDKYNVTIGNNTYNCIMFNDSINVTQGLEEIVNTEISEDAELEYKYASSSDRKTTTAYIIAKKNEAEIEALARKVIDISNTKSGRISIQLENAHKGYLHRLEISPIEYVSGLFPSNLLEPSEDLIPIDFVLIVDETKYILDIDYLNYIDSTKYDKFICEDGKCWIERIDGTIEEKEDLYIAINSNSIISTEATDKLIITATYLLENEYTNNFANQVEMSSQLLLQENKIAQTVQAVADDNGVVTSGSIILAINKDESLAEINADKINMNGLVTANENFKILLDGSIEAKNARFTGVVSGGKISVVDNYTSNNPYIEIYGANYTDEEPIKTDIWQNGIKCKDYSGSNPIIRTEIEDGYAELNGKVVNAYGFNNVSLESKKKDIEKLENALEIIKNIDIYKFRYKDENEFTKKHIGLVIGENYKYSEEVTSKNNQEVDLYSLISVCCEAIKELQKEIVELKEKIK